MIVGPLGDVLAGPERSGPAMLVAELDLEDIVRAAFDFDPVGHYLRSDLFTLHVRTGSDRSVVAAPAVGGDAAPGARQDADAG